MSTLRPYFAHKPTSMLSQRKVMSEDGESGSMIEQMTSRKRISNRMKMSPMRTSKMTLTLTIVMKITVKTRQTTRVPQNQTLVSSILKSQRRRRKLRVESITSLSSSNSQKESWTIICTQMRTSSWHSSRLESTMAQQSAMIISSILGATTGPRRWESLSQVTSKIMIEWKTKVS